MPQRKIDDMIAEYNDFHDYVITIAEGGGDVAAEIRRFQDAQRINRTMTAKDFSLVGAIAAFGLRYRDAVSFSKRRLWHIEEIPETKGFEPSPFLKSLIETYSMNFDRTSEAVCRTAVDFILNECLTAMKRNISPSKEASISIASDQTSDESSDMGTPPPVQDIKIFGEISFSHKIDSTEASYSGVIVNDRVDYGIGRIITSPSSKSGKRRFQSLLLLVEAKTTASLDAAFCQLVVYLGSLYHSRKSRKRSDASVYGVASDGFKFTFVTITHKGVLKRSKEFNITDNANVLKTVLGCLKYLLEKSASADGGHPVDVDGSDESDDPAMQLDDNEYIN